MAKTRINISNQIEPSASQYSIIRTDSGNNPVGDTPSGFLAVDVDENAIETGFDSLNSIYNI